MGTWRSGWTGPMGLCPTVGAILCLLALIVVGHRLIPHTSALTDGGVITTLDTPLTENFDTLASTGTGIAWTDNSTIPGWYSTRTTYNSGTGSSNAGALYSFGVAGTNAVTDRALGSVASGVLRWMIQCAVSETTASTTSKRPSPFMSISILRVSLTVESEVRS